MEIKDVMLGLLRPSEGNPRRDFGDLEGMAAGFAANALRPGEPFNPPVVVPFGRDQLGRELYRIVDGERRYRAMRLGRQKTDEVAVLVCDGMDEALAAVAMLATDDKERLTDEERARGFQDALDLGADVEVAEVAAGLKRGQGRRAASGLRAARAAGVEQGTFDLAFALADLEGDDEAVEAVTSAAGGGADWRRALDALMAERARAEKRERLSALLAEHGIEVVKSRPGEGYAYLTWANEADVSRREFPGGCVAVVTDGFAQIYEPDGHAGGSDEEDLAEDALMEEAGSLSAALSGYLERERAWYAGRITSSQPAPETDKALISLLFDERSHAAGADLAAAAARTLGGDVPDPRLSLMSGALAAAVWDRALTRPGDDDVETALRAEAGQDMSAYAMRWCGVSLCGWDYLVRAMAEDGYDAQPGETELAERLSKAVSPEEES